jgi:hypothetical protein
MTMQTEDIGQLRQGAVEKIIFHATPKKWLRERGPGRRQGTYQRIRASQGRAGKSPSEI